MTEETSKKKKYKYTKEITKIATDDGMTQEDIAKLCRISQSIVSGWTKGKKAYEHVIAPLVKKYGARLNRTAAKIYLLGELTPPRELFALRAACEKELQEVEEPTRPTKPEINKLESLHYGTDLDAFFDRHFNDDDLITKQEKDSIKKQWAKFLEDQKKFEEKCATIREKMPSIRSFPEGFAARVGIPPEATSFREEFNGTAQTPRLARVEGPVVFRYSFCYQSIALIGNKVNKLSAVPSKRWVLHRQADDRFFLVTQQRRLLDSEKAERWQTSLPEGFLINERTQVGPRLWWLESYDDAARWLSQIEGPMDYNELIAWVDAYVRNPDTHHNPHDEMVLPFLIRKALIEQGYRVEGVLQVGGLQA
jgi:transcriptional regulator with XRE-family HTH domain